MSNVLVNKLSGGAGGGGMKFPDGALGVYYKKPDAVTQRAVYELGTLQILDQDKPQLLWKNTYSNSIRGLSIDKDGNIQFCYDYDMAVVKINSQNNTIWNYTDITDGNQMDTAVDYDNYVYCGGLNRKVKKIDPSGKLVWTHDTYSERNITYVTVDLSKNTYGSTDNGYLLKINESGGRTWTKQIYTGIAGMLSFCIAVDDSENIYYGGNNKAKDYSVRKMNASGADAWSFTGHSGYIYSIAVDASRNVYSCSYDKTVRKINSSGTQVWSFTGHTNFVMSGDIDLLGNVYSGSSRGAVIKINSSGVQVWSISVSGYINSLAVDNDGYNIYTTTSDTYTLQKISLHFTQKKYALYT